MGSQMTESNPEKNAVGEFLRIPEVAQVLNCSVRKVWRHIDAQELRVHRFGGSTRIARVDLDEFISRHRS